MTSWIGEIIDMTAPIHGNNPVFIVLILVIAAMGYEIWALTKERKALQKALDNRLTIAEERTWEMWKTLNGGQSRDRSRIRGVDDS